MRIKKGNRYGEFERTFQHSPMLQFAGSTPQGRDVRGGRGVLMSTLVGDSVVVVHPLWSSSLCTILCH